MLASDMDLGRAVALKGVPDITSAPQHNRLLDVCNYARHNWHGLHGTKPQMQSRVLASKMDLGMGVALKGVTDITSAATTKQSLECA